MAADKPREEDEMQQRKWILPVLCACTAVSAFLAGLITGKVVFACRKATTRVAIESIPAGTNTEEPDAVEEGYHDE